MIVNPGAGSRYCGLRAFEAVGLCAQLIKDPGQAVHDEYG